MSIDPNDVVVWVIACTAFFRFFRLGELLPETPTSCNMVTDLAWGDVAVDNHTNSHMVQLHLKCSKSDQFGQGADVVVGATGTDICPISALCQYLKMRGSSQGPFFLDTGGKAIIKSFALDHRDLLQSLGFPAHHYAVHSFRIGAATTAGLVGMEDSMIQTLGRWHSAAFLRYIWTPKGHLANASASLVEQAGTVQSRQ